MAVHQQDSVSVTHFSMVKASKLEKESKEDEEQSGWPLFYN